MCNAQITDLAINTCHRLKPPLLEFLRKFSSPLLTQLNMVERETNMSNVAHKRGVYHCKVVPQRQGAGGRKEEEPEVEVEHKWNSPTKGELQLLNSTAACFLTRSSCLLRCFLQLCKWK